MRLYRYLTVLVLVGLFLSVIAACGGKGGGY
jgi:predicted small lipoprotein YifL